MTQKGQNGDITVTHRWCDDVKITFLWFVWWF